MSADDNLLAAAQEELLEKLEEDTKNQNDDYDSPFDFAQGTRGKLPLITI